LWLYSYRCCFVICIGWTNADSPDEAQLKAIGDEMRDRILNVHGEYYSSEKSISLYPTSGTASDWYIQPHLFGI